MDDGHVVEELVSEMRAEVALFLLRIIAQFKSTRKLQ
jgi:hypothetical protein